MYVLVQLVCGSSKTEKKIGKTLLHLTFLWHMFNNVFQMCLTRQMDFQMKKLKYDQTISTLKMKSINFSLEI